MLTWFWVAMAELSWCHEDCLAHMTKIFIVWTFEENIHQSPSVLSVQRSWNHKQAPSLWTIHHSGKPSTHTLLFVLPIMIALSNSWSQWSSRARKRSESGLNAQWSHTCLHLALSQQQHWLSCPMRFHRIYSAFSVCSVTSDPAG